MPAARVDANDAAQHYRALVEHDDQGRHEVTQEVHRADDAQGDALRPLQCKAFGRKLAHDNMQIGDDEEGQRNGCDIHRASGEPERIEHGRDEPGKRRFAERANGKRAHGDANLGSRDKRVDVVECRPDVRRCLVAGCLEFQHARASNADERIFSGNEPAIGQHDDGNAEQLEEVAAIHAAVILGPVPLSSDVSNYSKDPRPFVFPYCSARPTPTEGVLARIVLRALIVPQKVYFGTSRALSASMLACTGARTPP